MNTTYNYYICKQDLYDVELSFYQFLDNEADKMMTEVSKFIAFSDCHDGIMIDIVLRGRHVHYAGWQPGMVYEFVDSETGEVVWGNSFPSWDH